VHDQVGSEVRGDLDDLVQDGVELGVASVAADLPAKVPVGGVEHASHHGMPPKGSSGAHVGRGRGRRVECGPPYTTSREQLWKLLEVCYGLGMGDPLDVLEQSISDLRRAIRDAATVGDTERAGELRAQLRRAERAWDALVDADEPSAPAVIEQADVPPSLPIGQGTMLPAREHAHRALMLLQTPAAPKLIVSVHEAFFPGELSASKLSSLRRDEERSYRATPGSRPYYLCPALTHDLLSPARALVTISTWTLEQRIIGPLSPRTDFLSGAIRIAEAIRGMAESSDTDPSPAAFRLLWRFAVNIPGAMGAGTADGDGTPEPNRVIDAARDELEVHADTDRATRAESARRARKQLSDDQQMFGASLRDVRRWKVEA
jgi:hypothetical protein